MTTRNPPAVSRLQYIIKARPAPFFVGDHLAMDFLNTLGSPFGEPMDWIADGADLIAWLDAARAVPPAKEDELCTWSRSGIGERRRRSCYLWRRQ